MHERCEKTDEQLEKVESDFLVAWNDGGARPDLKSFVGQVAPELREQALEILIPVDLQYRFQAGDDCSRHDYAPLGEHAISVAAELFADVSSELVNDRRETVKSRSTYAQFLRNAVSETAGSTNLLTDRYRLISKIGQGGMGTVWLAQQEKPMRRRVAIKIISEAISGRESMARFAAERQALAMMDHPNIAKVLDDGVTEDDRPFFAMELVKGIPITQYCDEHELTIENRIQLLCSVCDAVAHAHQKGIIHRDLKPSNLLVSVNSGQPMVKVIDFGLAKSLEHYARLTEESIVTEFGRVVGTLQYMSPEQADAGELDIDTRADVYALGVVLYQLLTDVIPLERNSLSGKSLIQIVDLIRAQDVKRPSVRLSDDTEQLKITAKLRRIDSSKLVRALKGELDWIVLKALAKDRTERYQSAGDLKADLQRFINDEQVEARPPTQLYRLKKFISKNRGLTTGLACAAMLLLATSAVSSYFWSVAAQSEQIAKQKTEEMAELNTEFANRLTVFLSALGDANPLEGAKVPTAADVMTNVVANLKEFSLEPEFKATVLHEVGVTLRGSGMHEDAARALEDAFHIRRQHLGTEHLLTGDTLAEFAKASMLSAKTSNWDDGKKISCLEDALDRMDQAFKIREQNLDGSDPKFLLAETDRGTAYFFTFKELKKIEIIRMPMIDKAIDLLKSALNRQQEILGTHHEYTLGTQTNLANAFLKRGDNQSAIELMQQTDSRWEKLLIETQGADNKQRLRNKRAQNRNNLAEALQNDGQLDRAIDLYRIALQEKAVGLEVGHPIWQNTFRHLLDCLIENGQLESARQLYKDSISEIRRTQRPGFVKIVEQLEKARREIMRKYEVIDPVASD